MIRALLFAVALALVGCASYPKPDAALIAWGMASEDASWERAIAHANSIDGVAFRVMPTGSMEPFLTGGDWIVVDFAFPFAAIQPGFVLTYDANWRDQDLPFVTHMAAEPYGNPPTAWVMTGIANARSEAGSLAMTEWDYRGKVVRVYTTRKKQ